MPKPIPTIFLRAPYEIIVGKYEATEADASDSPYNGVSVKANDYSTDAKGILNMLAKDFQGYPFKRIEFFGIEISTLELVLLNWWEHNRPLTYDLMDHLNNPQINSDTDADELLCQQVGVMVDAMVQEAQKKGFKIEPIELPYPEFKV